MFHSIENLPTGCVGVEASGRIGPVDRAAVLDPQIDAARAAGDHVRLLYVAGPDFDGYEDGGAFDDAVFGTRHFAAFEKIAFVSDPGPFDRAVNALEGLMPADLRRFATADLAAAKAWLAK